MIYISVIKLIIVVILLLNAAIDLYQFNPDQAILCIGLAWLIYNQKVKY